MIELTAFELFGVSVIIVVICIIFLLLNTTKAINNQMNGGVN